MSKSKRASLDTSLFEVKLPSPGDPLDSLIPQFPPQASSDRSSLPSSPSVGEVKNVHSDERTSERTNVQKPVRRIIRHAFDIYSDQLYALQAIQLEAVQGGKKKPKLGTMVQRALDLYLQQRKRK